MGQAGGQGRRRPSAWFGKHNLSLQQEPQGEALGEREGAVGAAHPNTNHMITSRQCAALCLSDKEARKEYGTKPLKLVGSLMFSSVKADAEVL